MGCTACVQPSHSGDAGFAGNTPQWPKAHDVEGAGLSLMRDHVIGDDIGPVPVMSVSSDATIGLMDGLLPAPPSSSIARTSAAATPSSSSSTPFVRTSGRLDGVRPLQEGIRKSNTSTSTARRSEIRRSRAGSRDMGMGRERQASDMSESISVGRPSVISLTLTDCTSLADEADSEQLFELRRIFQCFERREGHERVIDVEHLGVVLDFMGLKKTKAEIDQLKREVDGDGSGTLDFDEFQTMAVELGGVQSSWLERLAKAGMSNPTHMAEELTETRTALRKLFGFFSKGGELVSTSDVGPILQAIGQALSEEEVNGLIAETDNRNSGTINFHEFVRLVDKVKKLALSLEDNADGYEASRRGPALMKKTLGDTIIDTRKALKAMIRDIDAYQRQAEKRLQLTEKEQCQKKAIKDGKDVKEGKEEKS
eukprot:TRINITY_DN14347_c0_g3_i1.p1 TRINITY_DN14347_c0_g3~~TRINITY_DN14347_c0_g3_i1.p1  ORF type:complete len:425 (+),score=84.68 TRINITY_DN14347_c0_g3_i1:170-1444(+)